MENNFEEIYGQESDAIFRFCLFRISDRDQALDLTQETFIRLWQSLKKGEIIKSPRAYLFTLAHRLIIDWYRKKKSLSLESLMFRSEDQHFDFIDEKTSVENLNLGLEGRYLLNKINELPLNHRQPVYLRYVEDLSPPEIGKILGVSANVASVRINRGIMELKKITGYNIEEIYEK